MTDAKRTKKESNEGSGDSGFQESAHQFCCDDFQKMSRMMENCECGDSEKMSRIMKNLRGVMDGSFNLGAMMQRMCGGAPQKHDAQ